jgi:hypothetical protein
MPLRLPTTYVIIPKIIIINIIIFEQFIQLSTITLTPIPTIFQYVATAITTTGQLHYQLKPQEH